MGFDASEDAPASALGGADFTDLDLVTEVDDGAGGGPGSPQVGDVWVGAVLAVTVLGCLLCVCSCLVHHGLRRWRERVLHAAAAEVEADVEAAAALPSYTLVSGLPTYDEALDQLQRARQLRRSSSAQRAIESAVAAAMAAGNLVAVRRLQHIRQLSVGELIQYSFRSNSFDKS